jgi:hypothetical protein
MTNISPPKRGFIETLRRLAWNGETRWIDAAGARLYTWDRTHGEFEVFNREGRHLGAVDAASGALLKPAKKGRSIDV